MKFQGAVPQAGFGSSVDGVTVEPPSEGSPECLWCRSIFDDVTERKSPGSETCMECDLLGHYERETLYALHRIGDAAESLYDVLKKGTE